MKPRSIISLIIAAVLILGGIITCAVASAKADSDGVMLFPEADFNGDLVYRMDLNGTTKITVDAADADIQIVGGAEKSVIEVINFNANYYKLNESNGSVNFAQVDDFMSMFKFWENGFSFKGMRYILRFGDDAAGDKRVIIKLASDTDLRLVNISTETGDISLKNCPFNADYTLKAENANTDIKNVTNCAALNIYGNAGQITADSVITDKLAINGNTLTTTLSAVTAKEASVKTTDGAVKLSDSVIDDVHITTVSGSIDIPSYKSSQGTLTTESGKISISFESTGSLNANVVTLNGKISVNGQFTDNFSCSSSTATQNINISTSGGDVYITHP